MKHEIEEESVRVLSDLFFSGLLEIKWNPKEHILMLKPLKEKEEDT